MRQEDGTGVLTTWSVGGSVTLTNRVTDPPLGLLAVFAPRVALHESCTQQHSGGEVQDKGKFGMLYLLMKYKYTSPTKKRETETNPFVLIQLTLELIYKWHIEYR